MSKVADIVILSALTAESRAIAKAVGDIAGVGFHVVGMRAVDLPKILGGSIVIVAGVGGGLDPSLSVGDLVLDTPVDGLSRALPWRIGRIHTADGLVATVAEKARLFSETGALAVDMEQRTIEQAMQATTQIIGLRAISDTAGTPLDPAILRFVDAAGRPRPLVILASLLQRPATIPRLYQLNTNYKLALRQLGLGVAALVKQMRVVK